MAFQQHRKKKKHSRSERNNKRSQKAVAKPIISKQAPAQISCKRTIAPGRLTVGIFNRSKKSENITKDILNDKILQKQTEEDWRDVINKSNTTSIRDIKDVERRMLFHRDTNDGRLERHKATEQEYRRTSISEHSGGSRHQPSHTEVQNNSSMVSSSCDSIDLTLTGKCMFSQTPRRLSIPRNHGDFYTPALPAAMYTGISVSQAMHTGRIETRTRQTENLSDGSKEDQEIRNIADYLLSTLKSEHVNPRRNLKREIKNKLKAQLRKSDSIILSSDQKHDVVNTRSSDFNSNVPRSDGSGKTRNNNQAKCHLPPPENKQNSKIQRMQKTAETVSTTCPTPTIQSDVLPIETPPFNFDISMTQGHLLSSPLLSADQTDLFRIEKTNAYPQKITKHVNANLSTDVITKRNNAISKAHIEIPPKVFRSEINDSCNASHEASNVDVDKATLREPVDQSKNQVDIQHRESVYAYGDRDVQRRLHHTHNNTLDVTRGLSHSEQAIPCTDLMDTRKRDGVPCEPFTTGHNLGHLDSYRASQINNDDHPAPMHHVHNVHPDTRSDIERERQHNMLEVPQIRSSTYTNVHQDISHNDKIYDTNIYNEGSHWERHCDRSMKSDQQHQRSSNVKGRTIDSMNTASTAAYNNRAQYKPYNVYQHVPRRNTSYKEPYMYIEGQHSPSSYMHGVHDERETYSSLKPAHRTSNCTHNTQSLAQPLAQPMLHTSREHRYEQDVPHQSYHQYYDSTHCPQNCTNQHSCQTWRPGVPNNGMSAHPRVYPNHYQLYEEPLAQLPEHERYISTNQIPKQRNYYENPVHCNGDFLDVNRVEIPLSRRQSKAQLKTQPIIQPRRDSSPPDPFIHTDAAAQRFRDIIHVGLQNGQCND